ncbi:hypothetical protein WL76_11955 [Burkholderia ubonensis]|uniref:hypothetical protein n=1 Tax=Burkholderia ubonensis TaxID=101571 RepID=UPI0007564369|nr:hypothetical protein [Burkholderia ubonensis]KWE56194.1 hypothetical protein WL76_11955 [Burkholderia ubonensis]
MTLLANFGLLAFLALSAYVLAIGGDWSFGQQAPFALGAYAGAAATVLLAWPLAAALAGGIAALGGALYAHCNTYVEPDNFDVMLGIHGLSYALIGGLGAPLGAFAGVSVDLGLLEGSRLFHGYRMIVFGGLVAVILVVRPRGLIDEALVAKLCGWNAMRIRRVMRVFSLSPLLLPRRLRRRAARRQPEQP